MNAQQEHVHQLADMIEAGSTMRVGNRIISDEEKRVITKALRTFVAYEMVQEMQAANTAKRNPK